MANKNYRKGYNFERRVRKYLESQNYIVFRCSRSKPFDLIAFSPDGTIYLIECKVTGRINKIQRYFQEKTVDELTNRGFNVKYAIVSPRNYKEKFM